MTTARTIKRYANRKLYDTRDSRYVTLDHIAAMVRAGDDVRVVENTTRADLTTATLAQIIFEEEKKTPRLSVAGLRKIIQGGMPAAAPSPRRPPPGRRVPPAAGLGGLGRHRRRRRLTLGRARRRRGTASLREPSRSVLGLEVEAGRERERLLRAAAVGGPVGLRVVAAAAGRDEVDLGGQEQHRQLQLEAAEQALAGDDVLVGKGEVGVQVVVRRRPATAAHSGRRRRGRRGCDA